MLNIGMKGTASEAVSDGNTAKAMGSGSLDVYATPSMIALMEKAACSCIGSGLDAAVTSVGTKLDVSHIAATPIGMTVSCIAELKEIDGRRLVFEVTASDEKEIIGKGIHERFIVNSEKFIAKANLKRTGQQ